MPLDVLPRSQRVKSLPISVFLSSKVMLFFLHVITHKENLHGYISELFPCFAKSHKRERCGLEAVYHYIFTIFYYHGVSFLCIFKGSSRKELGRGRKSILMKVEERGTREARGVVLAPQVKEFQLK